MGRRSAGSGGGSGGVGEVRLGGVVGGVSSVEVGGVGEVVGVPSVDEAEAVGGIVSFASLWNARGVIGGPTANPTPSPLSGFHGSCGNTI